MNREDLFVNPYLPSWEYVPDAEPHVFGDRVYIYGSHDRFNGYVYCMNDYICYSAPVNDLRKWRYEGVIYRKTQDPANPDGRMNLYAPDVTQGSDGRYYLYYVLDKIDIVSVAVCDTPAGEYRFLGYVRHPDGTLYGEKGGDEPQFDPGVLTEGKKTYLYTGFSWAWNEKSHGTMCAVLDEDMLTVREGPFYMMPSAPYSAGSGCEGHEFFEASSIRKIKGKYYFVYSSVNMHELCYAISDSPTGGFVYKGALVSNCDMDIDSYKPAEMKMYYPANNHGGILDIDGEYYIFYHRHTNATNFSRQACFEKLTMKPDGTFEQAEMTSCCGMTPLPGKGEYPTYMVCNLVPGDEHRDDMIPREPWMENRYPKVTQDGRDGDEEMGYIANMNDGSIAGFKYFDCKGVKKITVFTRGYGKGRYFISTGLDRMPMGSISVDYTNIWMPFSADIAVPDGVHALFFTYRGEGTSSFRSFVLE